MARGLDHLDLPLAGSSGLAQRGKPSYSTDRDRAWFADHALQSIRKIIEEHDRPERHLRGHDLDLLFKMRVRKYAGHDVREWLKRADCHTLVAHHDERFSWIVRANDKKLTRLRRHIRESVDKKSVHVGAIEEFSVLDPEEKFGELLREHPIEGNKTDYVVVDILKKSDDAGNDLRDDTLSMIRDLVDEHNLTIHDEFVSENMCQVLVMSNRSFLKVLSLVDYVYRIDRRPEFQLSQAISTQQGVDNAKTLAPPQGAHGILVLDTGMVQHPFLAKAIKEDFSLKPNKHDTKSHGTQVGGIAAYADLEQCIKSATFQPDVYICSGQIIYDEASTGSDGLAGQEISVYVDRVKKKFQRCKIVNLSIVAKRTLTLDGMQPSLSMAIDDLSNRHKDMIFVIAAGNILDGEGNPHDSYSGLSLNELDNTLLPDPATSVHAITVGSAMRHRDHLYIPSTSTRMGSGVNGIIKPDLVAIGGGKQDRVIVLSSTPHQKLFTLAAGTSLSAPIVSNYAARLMNRFPPASRNLITALLLSSGTLPAKKPEMGSRKPEDKSALLLHIYGHGMPNLPHAMHSSEDRVVFTHDGRIKPGSVLYFSILLPTDFFHTPGLRTISTTLSFDPPCSRDELSYMGTRMEFKIFANQPIKDIIKAYESPTRVESPKDSKGDRSSTPAHCGHPPRELKMSPGPRLRKRTNHQKGTHTSKKCLAIELAHPLILAVSCSEMWKSPRLGEQAFSVVVTVEHKGIDMLYDKIREVHTSYLRVRADLPNG